MAAAHSALFWAGVVPTLAVIALPVLIHLINMLRHRRVPWAAMEFLLASQKKNRTWIMLKQLLLLLLRMLAVATIVLIVAQPLLYNRWGNLFGSTTTHHIVLLDDSYSMSDRWADTSGIDEAKKMIKRLGTKAAEQVEVQSLTLVRFSRAGGQQRPDLLKEPVNKVNFAERLDGLLGKINASQTAAGPIEALKMASQLVAESNGDRRILYLISDFRTKEWNEPTEVRNLLQELNKARVEVHLVNCIDQVRPNLAITSLGPLGGIQAAGVPFFMEVAIHNFGTAAAKNVPVLLEEDGHARSPVSIAKIPPGREAKERFEVNFAAAGEHQLTARLESDAVAADNSRYSAFDLPADVPLLLVDGAPEASDARYIGIVCAPGGPVRTGIRTQIETTRYLAAKPLEEFRAINLMNVDRLDKSAVDALERFVAGGGGLAIFLGERNRGQTEFINKELYRDGQGFFPVPLRAPALLPVDRLEQAADVNVEEHEIFQDFLDERNVYLAPVVVQNYFAVADGWKPRPDSTTRVIARLRNGAPLVIERSFGKGRVVAVLTTAGPAWNNLARQPSVVAVIQRLEAYLANRPSANMSRPVGTPIALRLDALQYQPTVRLTSPKDAAAPATTADATAVPGGGLAVSFNETDVAGIYQARLTKADGSAEVRRFAVNVDPVEGNLATVSPRDLAGRLEGVNYQYEQAAAFGYSAGEQAGYNLGEKLLYFLIVLLIAEQILAFSASYHPATRRPAAAKGGAA
jgi:hypothetical protein